jgi:hypothetical protein
MLPPSMVNQPCSWQDMKKGEANKLRPLKGHDLYPDGKGGYYWYSDMQSLHYCAEEGAYFLWHSGHVSSYEKKKEPCPKTGSIRYDIYVTD